jgi:hypothetical protein
MKRWGEGGWMYTGNNYCRWNLKGLYYYFVDKFFFGVIADKLRNVALFTGLQEDCEQTYLTPNFSYSFCYNEEKSEIVLVVNNENRASISSVDWIKKQLFPKIIKWAETAVIDGRSNRLVTSSLNLVNIAKYNKLYQQLKKKYGLQMVQVKHMLIYWV